VGGKPIAVTNEHKAPLAKLSNKQEVEPAKGSSPSKKTDSVFNYGYADDFSQNT